MRVAPGAPSGSEAETFKEFVNGRVPIKEAVVYRAISGNDGALKNEDWWRFGYELGNWYVERLQPDPTNKLALVPKGRKQVYGASSSNLWAVSEQDLHLAVRSAGTNSMLDHNRSHRNMMFAALSLGVPRNLNVQTVEDSQIVWRGWNFSTFVVVSGTPAKPVAGWVRTNPDGLPASAEYRSEDGAINGLVDYEYGDDHQAIPLVFTARYDNARYRYEFLSLKLGVSDPPQSGGYTPEQFADLKRERHVTIWSNSTPHSLINSNLVSAAAVNHGQKSRLIILALLVCVSVLFLVIVCRTILFNNKQT